MKVGRKALCLIFAFLFSIESFAAVVSDNDGAAFVTKAEFEALKENFNNQIEQYNSSIDNKIDGAIASYLAARVGVKIQLDNLLEDVGVKNIRFGLPSFESCIAPVTGWATYFINCMPDGFTLNNQSGNYYCINNPADSRWATEGGGTTGMFRLYRVKDGAKYLLSSKKEMLQACYIGGWYSNANYRNVTHDYIFGNAPTVFKQPVVTGDMYGVDCYTSVYRPYTQRDWTLIQNYTCAWSVNTTANQIVIDEKEYNLPSDYRTIGTKEYTDHRGSHTINDMKVTYTNIRVYGWKTTTEPWSNFSPGFLMNSRWKTKIYGGVPLFETNIPGDVEIKNLKFVNTSSVGSNDVYFAISFGEFENSDTLKGTVKFEKVENATLVDEDKKLYKATSGTPVTLTIDADNKGVYYIKCQYQTSKPSTADDNKYTTIENGTTIMFTEG